MCTNPLTAYQLKQYPGDTSPLVFKNPPFQELALYEKLKVPCSKCIACVKGRTLRRAIQLYCELKTTDGPSWFVTITYDDDHLPEFNSLVKSHPTKFVKQIRNYRTKHEHSGKFRYEMCAEYGEKTQRPHYHLCAFNLELPDLEIYSEIENNGNPYKLYTSATLEKLWDNKGNIKLTQLTIESCLYVAQHVDKKIGAALPNHSYDCTTGECTPDRISEYSTRSSCPGIGNLWFEKWGATDLYNTDFIVINGKKNRIPAYFDKQLKKDNPVLYEQIKEARKANAIETTRAQNRYQAKYDQEIHKRKRRNKI